MGTNFYLKSPDAEPLHIGKSSAGWCFSLRVYPEYGINNLEDWLDLLCDPYAVIEDEYERWISPSKMLVTEQVQPVFKIVDSILRIYTQTKAPACTALANVQGFCVWGL
jgi:hypothetical protein